MKILLACAGGMSTGMLVNRMKEYADSIKITADIEAFGLNELADHISGTDIILLAPQIGYQLPEMKEKFPGIRVLVIEMIDYGMMNGQKVFQMAISNMEENRNGE